MVDLGAYRSEFPILEDRTYLISASLGPLSNRSRALAEEHLDLWQRLGPEELWFEHGMPRLEECRGAFARLIGADATFTAELSGARGARALDVTVAGLVDGRHATLANEAIANEGNPFPPHPEWSNPAALGEEGTDWLGALHHFFSGRIQETCCSKVYAS